MISIQEFLLGKNNQKQNKIHATDETLYRIVRDEIDKLGKDADLNHIDVSDVKNFFYGLDWNDDMPENLTGLFEDTDFQGDVSGWDMSNAEDTTSMFKGCQHFNCDISGWDMRNVECCMAMFEDCKKFNQDLSSWNMENIKNIENRYFMFNISGLEAYRKKWPKFGYETK